MNEFQVFDYLSTLVASYRYVFKVDEHLIDGYVIPAAYYKLDLHGLDKHPIHALMGGMKLLLLVVDSVEEILEMR